MRIPYERIKQRYLSKKQDVEPIIQERTERYEAFSEVPEDLTECIKLPGTSTSNTKYDEAINNEIDMGDFCIVYF